MAGIRYCCVFFSYFCSSENGLCEFWCGILISLCYVKKKHRSLFNCLKFPFIQKMCFPSCAYSLNFWAPLCGMSSVQSQFSHSLLKEQISSALLKKLALRGGPTSLICDGRRSSMLNPRVWGKTLKPPVGTHSKWILHWSRIRSRVQKLNFNKNEYLPIYIFQSEMDDI